MLGDYAHQAARSPGNVTHGIIAVEVINGEVRNIHPLIKTVDIRTKVKL
jgi:hypothetical protein